MKKLLSLLSALIVGGSTTLTVIACGNPSGGDSTDPGTDVNDNVKTWSKQSSNIAKALILAKQNNANTNALLQHELANNINNITNVSDDTTGNSYSNFAQAWGFNNTIQGISDQDFNSNSADTVDNSALNAQKSIGSVLSKISAFLPILQQFMKTNNSFSDFILSKTDDKYTYATEIAKSVNFATLNKYSSYTSYISTITGILSQFLAYLKGFDAESVLGSYFPTAHSNDPAEIQKALFTTPIGTNPPGWIANYAPNTDSSHKDLRIDSVTKKSNILQGDNQKLFQTWDQVALFKSGADLNYAIKYMVNSSVNLSDVFQKSITFNADGKATAFNKEEFAQGITKIYKAINTGDTLKTFINVVNLAAPIIDIIKYKILGFKPTQAFTTITTTGKSDPQSGVININDIMSNLSKILLTKDGFTNFFTSVFFPPKDANSDDYFLGLDVTCDTGKGAFAVEQIISPIESQIVEALNFAFDTYIEPLITKYYIQDIFNKIIGDLGSITHNFTITIPGVIQILNTFSNSQFSTFLTNLFTCKDENDLQNKWLGMWTGIGLQNASLTDFKPNSFLESFHNLLFDSTGKPVGLTNFTNIMSTLTTCIDDGLETYIDKVNEKTYEQIDFNNSKLWSINNDSIKVSFDAKTNQSTINYDLVYQGKTYQVIVVINAKAQDNISNSQKISLKSLIGMN